MSGAGVVVDDLRGLITQKNTAFHELYQAELIIARQSKKGTVSPALLARRDHLAAAYAEQRELLRLFHFFRRK